MLSTVNDHAVVGLLNQDAVLGEASYNCLVVHGA